MVIISRRKLEVNSFVGRTGRYYPRSPHMAAALSQRQGSAANIIYRSVISPKTGTFFSVPEMAETKPIIQKTNRTRLISPPIIPTRVPISGKKSQIRTTILIRLPAKEPAPDLDEIWTPAGLPTKRLKSVPLASNMPQYPLFFCSFPSSPFIVFLEACPAFAMHTLYPGRQIHLLIFHCSRFLDFCQGGMGGAKYAHDFMAGTSSLERPIVSGPNG